MTIIEVAKRFQLTLESGVHTFEAGVHEVEEEIAGHWYTKLHLVGAPVVDPAPNSPDYAGFMREKYVAEQAEKAALAAQAQAEVDKARAEADATMQQKIREAIASQAQQAQDAASRDAPPAAVGDAAGADADQPQTPEQIADKVALAVQAQSLGISVDGRWGADRLRAEIAAVQAQQSA